jgi:hypothetical protein
LEPQIAKYLAALHETLGKLVERGDAAARAPSDGADFGRYMSGLQEALSKLADRPAATTAPGADLSQYMAGLQEALARLAERPVVMAPPGGGTLAGGPPVVGAPGAAPNSGNAAQIPYLSAAGSGPAMDAATRDAIDKLLQSLRGVAEMVRGPQSRTILLDGRLVEAFDGLLEAEDLQDVLRALRPVRKANARPKS